MASLLTTLALAAPAVEAQTAPGADDPRVEEARAQYRNGVAAFSHQRFAEATLLFERSYHLRPHPVTLFNAAEARFRSGDPTGALDQLRELLAMTNPAPEPELVARTHTLAGQMGEPNLQAAVHVAATVCPECPAPPPPPVQCPPEPAPVEIHQEISPWAWALGGGSLVLVGIGSGLFAVASDYSSVYRDPTTSRSLQLHVAGSGGGYAAAGTILGLAGIGAAVGAVWLLTHPHAPPPPPMSFMPARMDLAVGPSGVGITGSF